MPSNNKLLTWWLDYNVWKTRNECMCGSATSNMDIATVIITTTWCETIGILNCQTFWNS